MTFAFCLESGERRPGVIRLSNGEEFKGDVWFGDEKLRAYEGLNASGGRYVNFTQQELVSVAFSVHEKSMEHPWRFKNAGSDEKEILPETYPLMELTSEIKLASGKPLLGHLTPLPVYVRVPDPENPTDHLTRKFILRYQFKGQVGQKYEDIVYVAAVVFSDAQPAAKAQNGVIAGTIAGLGKLEDVVAFGIERMAAYKAKINTKDGTFRIEDLPKDVYDIAVLSDKGMYVGLSDAGAAVKGAPRALETGDAASIAGEIANFRDFFDQQDVLAVKGHRDAAKVLVRQARVKEQHDEAGLRGKQLQRLDIWCWHLRTAEWVIDPNGRANLFRFFEVKDPAQQRKVYLVPELGAVKVDPAEKKTFQLDYRGGDNAKFTPLAAVKAEKKP